MKRTPYYEMAWLALDWQRPFESDSVVDLLKHLASHAPQTPLVFEIRGCAGKVKYYFGADRKYIGILERAMKAHGNIRFSKLPYGARVPVGYAGQLKISKSVLTLNTDMTEAVTRAALAAMMQPKGGEQVVLQIVLGRPYSPSLTPSHLPDPHASWFKIALGDVEQATAEAKASYKEKVGAHRFDTVIRLAGTGIRPVAEGNMLSLLSALRTLSSAGVTITSTPEKPDKVNAVNIPWSFPMRLSVKELANFLLLPSGDIDLPGVMGLHPKQIMPPEWYRNPMPALERTFAVGLDKKTRLSISPEDSKFHTLLIGPTGSGKSTAMQRLILSDIYAGRSVLVIDPKSELIEEVLERIPKHREDDVVIIDPSSKTPVGVNPLAHKDHPNPGLIADAILAVFQKVFAENWGIRSQDVISASLLTLVKAKGASLLWLPTLLTNEAFRKKVTTDINDPIGLEPFWKAFEDMRDSERRQEILPTLNKVRQFLLRDGLRNVLGQSDPKFNLADLFTKPRVVLVPLNKGHIGEESAKLLGSLIVGLTWTLALSRAAVPKEKRHLVSIYIDELQNYIASISSDFSDALAQARGLGCGITMAHQFRDQLDPEIRAGIDANARNKICFGVASDAKAMAALAPELEPEDFMALPQYQIYTSFYSNGRNTGWVSGKTLPLTPPLRNAAELKKKVAERYGRPGSEVEREYLELLAGCREEEQPEAEAGQVGRRRKS